MVMKVDKLLCSTDIFVSVFGLEHGQTSMHCRQIKALKS